MRDFTTCDTVQLNRDGYTTDYSSNYLYAYDGMFYGSDTNTTFLLNSNGEAVFEYEVGNA